MKKDTVKNRKNGGFSLSETLITVLLMSIILSGLTTGIVALKNSYEKIILKADALTLLATISESMEADFASASSVIVSHADDGSLIKDGESTNNCLITFNSGKRNYIMSFVNNDGMISISTTKVTNPFSVTTRGEHTSKLNSVLKNLQYIDPDESVSSDEYFTYTIVIETSNSPAKEVLSQDFVVRKYE